MDQPENQFEHAPVYSAPVVPQHQDVPAEPARMNWFQRLIGVLLSPTETFTDINRKPTLIVPMIILALMTTGILYFTFWRVKPDWEAITRKQMRIVSERFGVQMKEEDIAKAVEGAKSRTKYSPIFGGVFSIVGCLIATGVLILGMIIIQAKTTFKKVFSVVLWSNAANWLIYGVVFVIAFMVKDQESLGTVDMNNPYASVPTNPSAFLDSTTSGFVRAFAASFDLFSFWLIAMLAIGLAAIAGSKKIKVSKTATIVILFWFVLVLVKTVLGGFFT